MRAAVVFLAFVATTLGAVIQMPAQRSPSLRAKLAKEGRLHEFIEKQHLARANSKFSNAKTVPQPVIDYFDEFYSINITLGTPPQFFTVALDTGSANLWVIDAKCDNLKCAPYPENDFTRHTLDTTKSTTFKKDGTPFSIQYGTGSCSGYLAFDTLSIGSLSFAKQEFGVATEIAPVFSERPIDGILGLGWPSLAVNGVTPPMQNVLNQLDAPIFTVWFDRRQKPSEGEIGGLITFGGLDAVNCDAAIEYITLSSKTYWQFPISGFAFGSYKSSKRQEVYTDTGRSFLGAPTAAFNAIVKTTGAKFDAFVGIYTLPCDANYPEMTFTIGDKAYTVARNEYVILIPGLDEDTCVLAVEELQGGGGFGPEWILGQPFVRTYCNIHDIGQGRLGLSRAIHRHIQVD